MKCLSTRIGVDGLKRRRYLLEDGRRLTTLELPATVVAALGMSKARMHLAAWRRGEEQRARAQRIKALLEAGWKAVAIAREVGVSEAAVRQHRAKLTDRGSTPPEPAPEFLSVRWPASAPPESS